MPVRNRKYENAMQFILGALIFVAMIYEIARRLLVYFRLHI